MNTQNTLKTACGLLVTMGYCASFEHPGYISLCGYGFGDANGDFGYNLENCQPSDETPDTLPASSNAGELARWIVDRIHHHRANPRFVLNLGAVSEIHPDMPEQNTAGTVILWDRQEKKPVVTIHAGYAQAICLETSDNPALSGIEDWFNSLSNQCLESEGITKTETNIYTPSREA